VQVHHRRKLLSYREFGLLDRRPPVRQGASTLPRFNDAGQRFEIKRYSDTAAINQIGRTTFGYDSQGRLADIIHRDALNSVLTDYDYAFDLADQLTSSTHHGQTTTYTYDDAGQLTAANHSIQRDESYSYDLNGNRNLGGYDTGPNNQVLSDGSFDYAYDGEGNLLTKTEIATGEITAYTYDHRNRLIAVRQFDSAGEDLLHEVTFTYDAFNRRIAKSVDSDGEGVAAAVVTRFVYDGDHVWIDYDGSGTVLTRYLFGDKTDEVLARYRASEGTVWHLTDNLGTVRDLVDEAGDLLNHIDYDSFGQIIAQSNAAAGDRFTYTGREWDAEIGLYYYRARYFDPQLGRFISPDPLGFDAGDNNLYRYVANRPLTASDPFGEMAAVETSVHAKEEAKTAPAKLYVACLASEAYFTVALAALGVPPNLSDLTFVIDCIAEAGAPGAGALPKVAKAVNSDIGHAAKRAVERGVFSDLKKAADALRDLSRKITAGGWPPGTIPDPKRADSVLVPFGNGRAVYEVKANGTAILRTVLGQFRGIWGV